MFRSDLRVAYLNCKISVDIPILNICPNIRIVPIVADATPQYLRQTDPIAALVFGDEISAKPVPKKLEAVE